MTIIQWINHSLADKTYPNKLVNIPWNLEVKLVHKLVVNDLA